MLRHFTELTITRIFVSTGRPRHARLAVKGTMRKSHDHFSKLVLEEILEPAGQVRLEQAVPLPDVQNLDVWFVPRLPLPRRCPRYLVLPYRMARRPCAFEPFSRTPPSLEVQDCHCKQLVWHRARRRATKRNKEAAPALHPTWILSPGKPRGYFARRRVRPAAGWPR